MADPRGNPPAGSRDAGPAVLNAEVRADELPRACREIAAQAGTRLAAIVATDERGGGTGAGGTSAGGTSADEPAFGLRHIFSVPAKKAYACLASRVFGGRGGPPRFPSVTPFLPAAHAFEREIREFMGLIPDGHPDLRPLLLHEDWPEGLHPLRKDFRPGERPPRGPWRAFPFQRVEGEGVFEIPVGPVHAGIIEPGHFRFSVAGEPIINLEIRLGFVHKGVEKHAEGTDAALAVRLAERVSGDACVAHALAYCQAVESVAGAGVPERARRLRVIFAELERIHNHLGDLAGIATDVGFPFGAGQMLILRERVLRRNEALTGHRLLRGAVVPGGVSRDLADGAADLRPFLKGLLADFGEAERLYLGAESLMDRVERTGTVSRRIAADLGGVGPAARASGIDEDCRRDHPYAAYGALPLRVVSLELGDVAARMLVKMAELRESAALIGAALDDLPAGPASAGLPRPVRGGTALGWAESSRGEVLHWLRVDASGRIERLKIKSPSFSNWPLLAWAVHGDIVPDFPLINKSFNLSYSGNDR